MAKRLPDAPRAHEGELCPGNQHNFPQLMKGGRNKGEKEQKVDHWAPSGATLKPQVTKECTLMSAAKSVRSKRKQQLTSVLFSSTAGPAPTFSCATCVQLSSAHNLNIFSHISTFPRRTSESWYKAKIQLSHHICKVESERLSAHEAEFEFEK